MVFAGSSLLMWEQSIGTTCSVQHVLLSVTMSNVRWVQISHTCGSLLIWKLPIATWPVLEIEAVSHCSFSCSLTGQQCSSSKANTLYSVKLKQIIAFHRSDFKRYLNNTRLYVVLPHWNQQSQLTMNSFVPFVCFLSSSLQLEKETGSGCTFLSSHLLKCC